ncbi:MAG TPA: hypothetical protein ENI33_07510 [Thermoplasmatales archaeon]|nr:hypothetical protein [Thermoplasmatales archaeon]
MKLYLYLLLHRTKSEGKGFFTVVTVILMVIASIFSPAVKVNADEGSEESIMLYFTFEEPITKKIKIVNQSYHRVEMQNLSNYGNSGEPYLPVKGVNVLLPQEKKVKEIIVSGNKTYLGRDYVIEPASEPVPFLENVSFSPPEPDEEIYNSTQPFPSQPYAIVDTYFFRGYSILTLRLYPVEYIPKSGEIYYYNDMTLRVKTEDSSINEMFRNFSKDEIRVKKMVDNPETTKSYTSVPQRPNSSLRGNYEYVIITTDELKASTGNYTFQDLVDDKIAKGISATIVTVENITSNPAYWNTTNSLFNDTQAQIRNFIRDAYLNWGTEYVLIGGDDDIIPARKLYVAASGEVTYMPSDLYYACLDGNFNSDMDNKWGESYDGPNGEDVDLIAEVYVGRACVDSSEEVSNFIMKTLAHEDNGGSYLLNAVMIGEYVGFGGVAEWGGNYKDEMIDGSCNNGYYTAGIPTEVYNITTLYDRDDEGYNWPKSELIQILNEGVHMINHLGHSRKNKVMKLCISDVENLSNNKYPFIYSQGCNAGAFDYDDCIAEHFTVTEHGAFAVIMNARYGWGEAYGTDGPSQRYDREFWDAIYGENIYEIGKANQDSKEDNLYRINEKAMRWCYYELNLFGDPESILFVPHDITVEKIISPDYSTPGSTLYINATIANYGFYNETFILINFTINGILIDNVTIEFLERGKKTQISFEWTTSSQMEVYDVKIEAQPVENETVTTNNVLSKVLITGADAAITKILLSSPYPPLSKITIINTTIINPSEFNVSNLNFLLKINNITIDNVTIPLLESGKVFFRETVWIPNETGWHIISACIEPDALYTENNYLNLSVRVPTTIYVDDDGTADTTSIQEAINWASNGDTIYVYSGTYEESLVIDKDINLIGENKENTVIRGVQIDVYTWATIKVARSHARISNFTITRHDEDYVFWGIYLYFSQDIFISQCIIKNMYAGGINIEYSSNNIISHCDIFNGGTGMYIHFSDDNTIYNCLIHNNSIKGIWICRSDGNNISKSYIYSNDNGIEIKISNDNLIFYNNLINNTCNYKNDNNSINSWDNGSIGNYWSDFDEPSEGAYDNNSDGIIDVPYNISGGNNKDNYPLANPVEFIKLYEGYNLITLPFKHSYWASNLYAEIPGCEEVKRFNTTKQDFDDYDIYTPTFGEDFPIEEGIGYFVKVSDDTFFAIGGKSINNISVELVEGWNALGWFKDTTTASSIYENISHCTIVMMWNKSEQDFDIYVPGCPYNYMIGKGDGFFVAVNEQSTWHGEG